MGVVPIYAFLRHSGKVLDFYDENPATFHHIFAAKIRHHFALGDMDCVNYTKRGEQVYIYIHHVYCKHTELESKQGLPYSKDEDE